MNGLYKIEILIAGLKDELHDFGYLSDGTQGINESANLHFLFQEGQLSVTGESMCTKYWLTA